MNRAELKAAAKQQIKGKIGVLFLVNLIIFLISMGLSFLFTFIPIPGASIATTIVTAAFTLSTIRIYLNVSSGKDVSVSDTFSGFDDFWSSFKVTFLVGLYTFLWSLLLIVPGIIKMYSYSMSMYVLAENKGKPARECIKESMAMTDGHKMDLFVLSLSFIGWELLCCITLGIAGIWILPYMQTTMANVYQSLKPVPVVFEETPVLEPITVEE